MTEDKQKNKHNLNLQTKKSAQKNYTKQAGIMMIILWSVVILMVLGAFIFCFVYDKDKIFSDDNGVAFDSLQEVKVVEIKENITDVDISWLDGRVNIYCAEDGITKVVQSAEKELDAARQMKVNVIGSKMTIAEHSKKWFNFGFSHKRPSCLDVYLPKKIYDEINVENVGSSFTCQPIEAKTFNLETVSGKSNLAGIFTKVNFEGVSGALKGNNLQVQKFDGETVSGSIDLAGTFEDVDLETVSGEVSVSSSLMLKSYNSSTISGDISLQIPENTGFAVDFDTISGSFNSDFSTQKTGSVYIYKNGSPSFEGETVSGDFNISLLQ